ncbi:MAG: NAD(+) synthase [Candidatus Methylacidiphilales bacterium]|nr:NAD(+) synthase [Candidatus Methylacidiphilales bacterium]
MKLIKVAAAVLNQTPIDWDNNEANIRNALRMSRAVGATIVCMPELCVTGYGCEDAFHASGTHQMAWQILQNLLPETRGMIVCIGLPVLFQNGLYNCAALVVDGVVAGFVAKRFLAGDGIHYEPRWFKPWTSGARREIILDGHAYPIGDLRFEVGGVKIGFEICEDAWVAARPGATLALRGIDVILNPSASHFAFGKINVRRRFVLEGSRAFGVSYIYSNLLGNESGRAIYDGGALIASAGRMLAEGQRFSYRDAGVLTAVIDVDATRMNQARTGSFQPLLTETINDLVSLPHFTWPSVNPPPLRAATENWETSVSIKEHEFSLAMCLGLYDYMRKSRSNGFVVSLSGGADSAAVSVLVAMMVEQGISEIGSAAFLAKLTYLAGLQGLSSPRDIIGKLLTCVYQATANSGEVTRNAARAVAEAIGARYHEFDVEALVQGYRELARGAAGRELDWKKDDIALQNIQARVRGPGVWFLANMQGALLLSTSNRSEAAVGYATMDGDTCGGLSPIAGIDKAFLRKWLRWIETDGVLHPIPELTFINKQAPTAELRPAESKQTDEDDLMPYPVLDAIERAAIRDKNGPLDCYRLMRVGFPEYASSLMAKWVERFFNLWCRNQWKRERYAPSFHLDDENLDPKTWCRFPILSGGFSREIEALRVYVDEEDD